MLTRYGSGAQLVFDMEIEQGVKVFMQCMQQRREEKLFSIWVSLLPWDDSHETFEDFIIRMNTVSKVANLPETPTGELMNMARQIEMSYIQQKGG